MRRSAVRAASLIASLVLLLALTSLATVVSLFHAPGPSAAAVTVVLPRGASLRAISERLESVGAIENATVFFLWVRLVGQGSMLKAGEYRFPARARATEVARMLAAGETFKRRFTVVEGFETARTLAGIADAEGLEGAVPNAAEGTLLPETYQYEWGDTRAGLVARMQEAMDAALAEVWQGRAEGLPFDSPEQILILASIVERETGVPDERAHIAGVFVNRLRLGMRLQSDPTVAYGLGRAVTPDAPLTRADLDVDHPFNTYRHAGLPPAAIANPGRAALEAVANPMQTDDLYFVADGTGGHAFAATLEAHNRNVARFRALGNNR